MGDNDTLQPGTEAPDFTLSSSPDETWTLREARGHPVILAFYPGDWSPVCGDQMTLYNHILSEFQRYDAELIGISVDSVWSHAAYREAKNLHFTLLADFEPKGAVSRRFGAYDEAEGTSKRALFVVDEAGTIFWSYLSPANINPGADGILQALEELSNKTASARS